MKPKFLAPGTVIAERYEVRGLISSGNFGMVYRVYDRTAGEDVALKRLHASAQAVPEQLARFEREAKLGSRLDHPNIVPHLASGVLETVHGGGPYLILALVRGLPLGDLIDTRRRLRVEESVHILAHVLDALDAVHREGAIHRDLKPDNILLASPAHARGDFDMAGSIAARVGVPEPEVTHMELKARGIVHRLLPQRHVEFSVVAIGSENARQALVAFRSSDGALPRKSPKASVLKAALPGSLLVWYSSSFIPCAADGK